ncbi:SDR family oxidoreductase [Deinococcus soli (ex Cha et al. 2016)]|uniref:NADP-dependent 3-hydroxy acid dehydrogenase YdfG n=2 Tax=Deinococcus soli (ex Cha et al. 2016) TaxID=1309411 RepID=A0ACC6KMV9_9DEIO|nr:SDR family oxidoreductase [Deinococcus soli (ex Cha et al. 2016)]MDR6220368.1 NADP-dependent 3-hydroxy acid dehydrogenase YdfG [Deinococcus soli (ex Cha et al. 2016)]MDR6330301.1 NADP-dependent 3-hydroxy acid dehydrogenase YdfG [Deinococcus soli (ex Cha et al. 2016)]MDR6753853.1 NADP-dependent 3-hydroxy acid dehydrogenase YdfG [Deinococcus soli (ex Cha et al. 2016)]
MSVRPVTVVTGAAGGIGAALARELAAGHDLILSGRNVGALEALCAEVGGTPLVLDLTRPESFEAALAGLGRVSNVVHNAGVVELGAVAEQDHAVWSHTLAVNVVAPAELTRLLLPRVRAERGSVVFVNSGAGLRANAGWGSYAASKFALKALADALREEEAAHGVRVTSVYPGRTATPMQEKVRSQEGAPYTPEAFVRPESVAALIAFALNAPRDALLPDLSVRPGPQ